MSDKKEPKSWRDIVADGIETARSETVATLESAWTGHEVAAERLEYEDVFEKGNTQTWQELLEKVQVEQSQDAVEQDMDYER